MKTISGTKEWSASSVNCQVGCINDCWYCYARANAARFGSKDPGDWCNEEGTPLRRFGKRKGTIMFPTTHDIHPGNLGRCLPTLRALLEPGNRVLIVSKPWASSVARLCEELAEFRSRILFRFTIGSIWSRTLSLWEPFAPCPEERIDALRIACVANFATSVSMEPILEPRIHDVECAVFAFAPYVTDSIWIGRMNSAASRLSLNRAPENVRAAGRSLAREQSDDWVKALYHALYAHPLVRWKESIKKVVGLERPTAAGLDI